MSAAGSKTKKFLAERIQANLAAIEKWYAKHAAEAPPPIYCSIDLRDSGHKIVPVDSNLYPAGFNNICPEDMRVAGPLFKKALESSMEKLGHSKGVKQVLILPESHTTNVYYIENLYFLRQVVMDAGCEARIGWYGPVADGGPVKLTSASGKELEAFPIKIEAGVLSTDGFVPDAILLNNDFSSGYPEALDAVTQPILPSYTLGWHSRKKSEHFRYYNQLAAEFAAITGIDPWTIQIETEEVSPVDFNEDAGIDRVSSAVGRILEHTRLAYEARKIARKPFVYVKNNAGTYGMGILVAHSADELLHLNRRAKNKMSVGKNRMHIDSVAVQEGVPTATLVDRLAAEPVIYLFGCELMGGFLRTNTEKSDEENLNSQGMVFRKLCMADLREATEEEAKDLPQLELVYGSIARISALATGMELAAHRKKKGPPV